MAHTPTNKQVLSRPIIAPDMSAKVPSNVRQRYLNSIVEECIKLYQNDHAKAYERAVKEEKECR